MTIPPPPDFYDTENQSRLHNTLQLGYHFQSNKIFCIFIIVQAYSFWSR